MEFLQGMNQAMEYIERHLEDSIDYKELAAAASCAQSAFQRIFTYITGISLAEYIRRRRISAAGLELRKTEIKILDLAVKYGYESSASFSRAFQAIQGITPTEARQGKPLKIFPPLTFRLSVKGAEALSYEIIRKPAFQMTGVRWHVSRRNGGNLQYMPELWKKNRQVCRGLAEISLEKEYSVYGLTENYTEEGFDYWIAVISEGKALHGERIIYMPEADWAIFDCVGPMPQAQYEMWRRVFCEWLPFSGCSLAELPQIERYGDGDPFASDYKSQIWIPVHL